MSERRAACHGIDPEDAGWPTVSVVIPVRNEAAHLNRAVASILRQDYPIPFDVCIAVAPSDDATETIATEIAARDDGVSVVPNPSGATPAGLNRAIAATTGDVVVRVDGHARLSDGYLRRAVATMRRTGAVNVGGMQAPHGETPFEADVAAAMTSRVGTGGSRFHVGGPEGPVDTVYLGVFNRSAGEAVGWFDESLIRNQDYELNIRLREAGGTVWFDPQLSATYRPRPSIRTLARQYFDYGAWKAEVLRLHPRSLRLRQLVPALLPSVLLGSMIISVRRPALRALPIVYLVVSTVIQPIVDREHRPNTLRGLLVLPTMHLSWGLGFWSGALRRR